MGPRSRDQSAPSPGELQLVKGLVRGRSDRRSTTFNDALYLFVWVLFGVLLQHWQLGHARYRLLHVRQRTRGSSAGDGLSGGLGRRGVVACVCSVSATVRILVLAPIRRRRLRLCGDARAACLRSVVVARVAVFAVATEAVAAACGERKAAVAATPVDRDGRARLRAQRKKHTRCADEQTAWGLKYMSRTHW